MKEEDLDYVLVPVGLLVMSTYHMWLRFTIIKSPSRTVIGINVESRHQWVLAIMSDPLKNGVLAVQTIRNNKMASTLLATTAITLYFVDQHISSSGNTASKLVYGNKSTSLFCCAFSLPFFAMCSPLDTMLMLAS